MKKILIIKNSESAGPLAGLFQITLVNSYREALLPLISNPDFSAIAVYSDDKNPEELKIFLRKVNVLNPVVSVFIINPPKNILLADLQEALAGVKITVSDQEIPGLLDSIPENKRKNNRISWPLTLYAYKKHNPDIRHEGIIYSLSVGGAGFFIDGLNCSAGEIIFLNIRFRSFSFLAEAAVLRVIAGDRKKMAVKFSNVTPATLSYIENVINDKLMAVLLA